MALVNLTIANFAGILIVPLVMLSLDRDGQWLDSNHIDIFASLFKLLTLPSSSDN